MKQRQKMFTLAAGLATSGALATALLVGDPAPPQVSVADVNPGTSVERDLCLSVSLAPGAASECGDLRLAHALPAVRTLNRARAPVLLYNSQHASPHPIVAAHVTLPSGSSGLSRVVATLKVNGTPRGQGVWKGSAWPGSGPVRIAVGYDASGDSTGPYRYTLEVSAHYGETALSTTARGELVVVNRRESVFGAGWWLAGLERLVMDPFGKPVLWVGGDGSTRRYTRAGGADVWGALSLDRPDSIKPTTNGGWERILGGGVKVEFDATGRHGATVNRLTHRTGFVYDAQGRVRAVTIPEPEGVVVPVYPAYTRGFTFHYATDGKLERMESPGVGGTSRVTHLHRNGARVDSIRDADESRVRFGYADASSLRVTSRTDRRGYLTDFGYDAGHRISSSTLWMDAPGTGESNTMTLRAAESLGLTGSNGAGALGASRAYALLDGPRTDVKDTTALWLDRWGAPVRIVDAANRETLLSRGDPRFPVLVTRIDGPVQPNGKRLTIGASYDARGNLTTRTDSSRSELRIVFDPEDGHASNRNVYATTRYAYEDPHWPDLVTRIVLPEGETTTLGYDSAKGHRLWEQVGPDMSRRVSFTYYSDPSEPGYAPGLLKAVEAPPPPPIITPREECTGRFLECRTVEDTVYPSPRTEKVEYDARGNLEYSTSAMSFRTRYHNDELGRTWKTDTPIEGGLFLTSVITFEPNSDLVSTARTTGPAMNGVPEQNLWVRNRYDDGGNLRFVERWSDPDIADVRHLTTEYRYDGAGRKRAEFAPDLTPADTTDNEVERWIYDPAGNIRQVQTRRRDASDAPYTIDMTYDELNRLRTRTVPAVRYGPRMEGIPARITTVPGNSPYGDLTIPSSVETFTYDAAGNLETANNASARVRRSYDRNGELLGDTLQVANHAGVFVEGQHVYGLEYSYDLNGRQRSLKHPHLLAPVFSGVRRDIARFGYDPVTGALASVTDVLGSTFRFTYNMHGEIESLTLPRNVVERYTYDDDGRLGTHRVTQPGDNIRETWHTYDEAGHLKRTANSYGTRDVQTNTYSGLGYLVASDLSAEGVDEYNQKLTYANQERFSYDALANRTFSRSSALLKQGVLEDTTGSSRPTVWTYEPGTGRLAYGRHDQITDLKKYDRAGNLDFTTQEYSLKVPMEDRASYYAADGKLWATDTRTYEGSLTLSGVFKTVYEEYRYDALGRRIWVHARRFCTEDTPQYEYGWCNLDIVRRTVWDGDRELYEIQMPGDGAAEEENDTETLDLPLTKDNLDVNPHFGRVAYAYGAGVDQPISVVRIGYVEHPYETQTARWEPFTIVPLWNSRRQADMGYIAQTGSKNCLPANPSRCMAVGWRVPFHVYGTTSRDLPLAFHGTLLTDKPDFSGTLYRRNRYYDPKTGRFTQEDPIGLAGGLNSYGFANGDPVGYSDPYGLSAEEHDCPPCGGGNDANPRQVEREVARARFGASLTRREGWPQRISATRARGVIDPARIRFSQSSIRGTFKDGRSFHTLVDGLRTGRIKPADVDPIRLVRRDNELFTLDNRRLAAFQEAGVRVPYRMATPDEVASEGWKFTTRNGGTSIRIRGEP